VVTGTAAGPGDAWLGAWLAAGLGAWANAGTAQ